MLRNRMCAFAIVGLVMTAAGLLAPDPAAARYWLFCVALPVGYGHLLAAFWYSRHKLPARGLDLALLGSCLVTALCAYSGALRGPARFACLAALLFASVWHTVENDLQLARAYRGGLRLGALPRAARHHALALIGTLLVGSAALATPDGSAFLRFHTGAALPVLFASLDDIAIAVILYHEVSWLLFFLDRARRLPGAAARTLRWRLVWIHALPVAIGALAGQWLPVFWGYAVSLHFYLFWSAAHVLHTAWARGLEPA
jgi:hypothetical protein